MYEFFFNDLLFIDVLRSRQFVWTKSVNASTDLTIFNIIAHPRFHERSLSFVNRIKHSVILLNRLIFGSWRHYDHRLLISHHSFPPMQLSWIYWCFSFKRSIMEISHHVARRKQSIIPAVISMLYCFNSYVVYIVDAALTRWENTRTDKLFKCCR